MLGQLGLFQKIIEFYRKNFKCCTCNNVLYKCVKKVHTHTHPSGPLDPLTKPVKYNKYCGNDIIIA